MSGIEKAPHKIGFRRSLLKSYTRRFVAIAGVSFALLAGSLRAEFAYVANSGDNNVSAYHIDPATGALMPVAGSPFPTGNNPVSVAVGGLRFVYVGNEGINPAVNGNVSAYRINPTTGALTPVAGSPFPAGDDPISIAVEPLGRFVYVVNAVSNNVSAYRINPATGALMPVAGSPFPAGHDPISIAVGQFRFVYVANVGTGTTFNHNGNVSAYSINPTTGALIPVDGSPFPAGINSVSVAVGGLRFVYVGNVGPSPFSGNVSAF